MLRSETLCGGERGDQLGPGSCLESQLARSTTPMVSFLFIQASMLNEEARYNSN